MSAMLGEPRSTDGLRELESLASRGWDIGIYPRDGKLELRATNLAVTSQSMYVQAESIAAGALELLWRAIDAERRTAHG